MTRIAAGRVERGLAHTLRRCGYRTYSVYPWLGAFLSAKSLSGVEPRFDQRANVAGDATPERVVIVDRYVLVYGPGFKRGENYAYFALPYGIGGRLVQRSVMGS